MGERPPELGRRPEPAGRQRERLAVERGPAQESGQVRAGPQAVHVRLAATRLTVDEQLGQRATVVDVDLGDRFGGRLPERPLAAVRQDDVEAADLDAIGRRHGDPPGDPRQDGFREPRGAADRARCGHRVASPCRWNRAPRSHSRSACQWIMPMVLWLASGWRSSIRRTIRSDSRRRRQVQARVQQQPVVLRLVDRDPQPRGLVADAHRVPPGHLDERRDVERLVHRVHEGRRVRVAAEHVQVSLAVGVVDLDDHDLQVARAVPAQEEAGRVEHVAEASKVGHERDLPAVGVDAFAAQAASITDARTSCDGGTRWSSSRNDSRFQRLRLTDRTCRGTSSSSSRSSAT